MSSTPWAVPTSEGVHTPVNGRGGGDERCGEALGMGGPRRPAAGYIGHPTDRKWTTCRRLRGGGSCNRRPPLLAHLPSRCVGWSRVRKATRASAPRSCWREGCRRASVVGPALKAQLACCLCTGAPPPTRLPPAPDRRAEQLSNADPVIWLATCRRYQCSYGWSLGAREGVPDGRCAPRPEPRGASPIPRPAGLG